MLQNVSKRNLPSGTVEILPLAVGIIGVAIPVTLAALAATGKSVLVLVLALLTMLVVGAATLAFVLILTNDEPDQADDREPHNGSHTTASTASHS